jgi:hypothetical protein
LIGVVNAGDGGGGIGRGRTDLRGFDPEGDGAVVAEVVGDFGGDVCRAGAVELEGAAADAAGDAGDAGVEEPVLRAAVVGGGVDDRVAAALVEAVVHHQRQELTLFEGFHRPEGAGEDGAAGALDEGFDLELARRGGRRCATVATTRFVHTRSP